MRRMSSMGVPLCLRHPLSSCVRLTVVGHATRQVIFLLSWKKGDHDTLLGSLNLICTVVLVIAKLPQMHKVRIFGINS